MKKIFNFLKTFLSGIIPAAVGGLTSIEVYYIIKNIQAINMHTGWNVVKFFLLAFIELILVIILIYEFGIMKINSKNWTKHVKNITEEASDTIASSSPENETSDEAADTYSETKSKGKRKKS